MTYGYFKKNFTNESKSDTNLVIEGNIIPVNRSVLSDKSNFFAAMFRSNMIESKSKLIFIETQLQPFLFVLMLAYRCVIGEEVWNLKTITDIIQSLIIANKYLFCNEVVETLSERYFKKLLESETKDRKAIFDNLSLICKTYKLANYYNLNHLIQKCEYYFDEHPSDTLLYFEKHSDYPIKLLENILKRDMFGIEEITIFNFVNKLIPKHGIEAVKPLFDIIRFDLMSFEEISTIITNGIFDGKTNYSLSEITRTTGDTCSRICLEVGKNFNAGSDCRMSSRINLRNLCGFNSIRICTFFSFPMETRINYLCIQIRKLREFDPTINLENAHLVRIEIFSGNKIKTSFDYHLIPKIEPKLRFKPRLVSRVSIHCDYRLLIPSVSYGFTKHIDQFEFVEVD